MVGFNLQSGWQSSLTAIKGAGRLCSKARKWVWNHKSLSGLIVVLGLIVFPWLGTKARSVFSGTSRPVMQTLVPIANTTNVNRRADVVFVHGLGGDGIATWTSADGKFYWPKELGDDLTDIGVWVVNYEAHTHDWLGHTMPIERRAIHLLESFKNNKLGERRIIFIGHSLGGLLSKQMIQDARDLGINEYRDIALRTRAVVFVGTPNTGSGLASAGAALKRIGISLGANITQDQLENNAPVLLRLNTWYRNNSLPMEIKTKAFSESDDTRGVRVVDDASADPNIQGTAVVPLPGDHLSICKPASRTADVYQSVRRFIDQEAVPLPGAFNVTFAEFVEEYAGVKDEPKKLFEFLAAHARQEVVWDGYVMNVTKDVSTSSCTLGVSDKAEDGTAIATFQYWNFKDLIVVPGAKIRVRGIISTKSSPFGVILSECRLAD